MYICVGVTSYTYTFLSLCIGILPNKTPTIVLRSSKTDSFLSEGLPLLLQIDSYLENQLLNESGVVGPKLVNRGYCHLKTIKNSRITRGSLQRYRNQSITNNINFLLPGTARDSSRNCFYWS